LAHQLLGALLILPQIFANDLAVELLLLRPFGIDLKDTPEGL
jgi:hypothetical protein